MRRWGPVACLLLLGAGVAACGGSDDSGTPATPTSSPTTATTPPATTPTILPSMPTTPATPTGPAAVIGTIATGLEVPWGIAFLPDGTALVTERTTAHILAIAPDHGVTDVGKIDVAQPQGEGGLLGLATSPTYAVDHLIYAYVTTSDDNRVVKLTYDPTTKRLGDPVPIFTGAAKASNHNGGRLLFDPTGNLLVSTGDAADSSRSQSTTSPNGKILRITTNGDAAPGNPIPGSPIWSMGHRNVQGMAYDDAGRLWASEFGQNTWDELNLIQPGDNYGWPTVEGIGSDKRFHNPVLTWTTDEASPSGLAYRAGALWMGALHGERLWRIPVDASGQVGKPKSLFVGDHGRIRTVVVAPDGNLWISTSNRDGRGSPGKGDDRILVVSPGA